MNISSLKFIFFVSSFFVASLFVEEKPSFAQDLKEIYAPPDVQNLLRLQRLKRDATTAGARNKLDVELKKKMEEHRKKHEEAQKERLRKNEERHREDLKNAKAKYVESEATKASDPGSHLRATVQLSNAYNHLKQIVEAKRYQQEVFDILTNEVSSLSSSDIEYVFRLSIFSRGARENGDIVAALRSVLVAAHKSSAVKNQDWQDKALRVISDIGYDGKNKQEQISLVKFWLALEPHGEKFESSIERRLTSRLADLYEKSDNMTAADETHKLIIAKCAPKSNESITAQFHYALFCIRNGNVDESERVWKSLGAQVNWQFPIHSSRSFQSLLDAYSSRGLAVQFKHLNDALYAHPSAEILRMLDEPLKIQVNELVSSTKLGEAEVLLRRRLDAGKSIPSADPGAYWALTLSDVCLANGKVEESNQIFDKVINSMALAGLDTTYVKSNRAQLITRMSGIDSKKSSLTETTSPVSTVNQSSKPIVLNYALVARTRIDLKGNVSVGSRLKGEKRSIARGNNGNIYCPGQIKFDGNVRINGTVYGALNWKNLKSVPIKTPLTLPPAFSKTDVPEYSAKESYGEGGDYKSASLQMSSFAARRSGRIRIFLYDSFNAGPVVATLQYANGSGNPSDLQIWYNGTRKIVMPHNSQVRAIIYAPNAEVHMPSNNHSFTGAIVANSITGEGNISIAYDEGLQDQRFEP